MKKKNRQAKVKSVIEKTPELSQLSLEQLSKIGGGGYLWAN